MNKNGFLRATRYGSAVAATDCPPIVREAGKDFSKSTQRWWPAGFILRGTIVSPILFEWFETSTNPLQFAIFLIALGRQMEISCRQHLFPLPETLDELYRTAATHGLYRCGIHHDSNRTGVVRTGFSVSRRYRLLLGRRTGYWREWTIGRSHWGGRLHGICARHHTSSESSEDHHLLPKWSLRYEVLRNN